MTELDTLKNRKEQLLLERDIAALERKASRDLAFVNAGTKGASVAE